MPEETPLVTVARDGNSRVLAAANAVAQNLGLRPGMKLAQGQALVPGLAIHDADPQGDAAALVRLAGWCLRYAPLAAADPPDGLWIDVTGSTHLQGGEAAMLHDLVRRLTRQGLAARAAVADTPAVAHALARFGADPVTVVPPDAAVPPNLPIQALRLPPTIVASLRLMGFDQIGALANAARAPLVRRFGALLATRLDQASGKTFESIMPVVPAERIQARLSFVEPLLTPEAFSAVIARLTVLVCADLERAGRGARCLDLLFERVDGSLQVIRIGSARAARDVRHLARMLDERLEQVDPGLGVEAMRLVVSADDRVGFIQTFVSLADTGANSPDIAPMDIAPLVDRLVNRLGETRVYRLAPVESHVPERSVRKMPPLEALLGSRRGQGWPADLPRPVRLLDPPQPVDAMALLPDHPPIAFTWRRMRHRVRRADGPERIAGEWWKRDGEMRSVRDYFRVEDEDGRRFWLFRRGDGSNADTGDMRWFLHGFF
ncbi:Y-family DNA polymerase [Rhodopila sp.]|uniref:Y-family DNA polymerase n=1 Tax=Rhodopila sp. TaxID=2480087 RepID=UPI003D0E6706